MDYILRDKSIDYDEDQIIYLYNQDKFPRKKFPPGHYKVLNQITRIHVSNSYLTYTGHINRHLVDIKIDIYWLFQIKDIIEIHKRTDIRHDGNNLSRVELSVDGVNESNSTSTSLEIVSFRFKTCKEIYIALIFRPQVHNKVSQKPTFECYLCNIIKQFNDLGITIELCILDAPERSACRKQKQHGGYFSWDTCYANPENYKTPGRSGCKFILSFSR